MKITARQVDVLSELVSEHAGADFEISLPDGQALYTKVAGSEYLIDVDGSVEVPSDDNDAWVSL